MVNRRMKMHKKINIPISTCFYLISGNIEDSELDSSDFASHKSFCEKPNWNYQEGVVYLAFHFLFSCLRMNPTANEISIRTYDSNSLILLQRHSSYGPFFLPLCLGRTLTIEGLCYLVMQLFPQSYTLQHLLLKMRDQELLLGTVAESKIMCPRTEDL